MPVTLEINTALLVEADPLFQQALTLALGTLSPALTDFALRVDNPVRRHIGIDLKTSQGMSHDLGGALPCSPGHLTVCGNPAIGDLADGRINAFPSGLVPCLEKRHLGVHATWEGLKETACPTPTRCESVYSP